LRVGLGWIYLPNASSKKIPNTSFALFANYFFKQNERISPGWLLATPKGKNGIGDRIRKRHPLGKYRRHYPENDRNDGLSKEPWACAAQH